MPDNPLLYLLLGLLFAWVASYLYSIQHNRRRLRQLAMWLKDALPLLGGRASSTWHGADRLTVSIPDGRGNIREAAIVLGMQSRQLFRALVSLLRGGRDSLTMLVSLHKGPVNGNEFEIFEAAAPLPKVVVAAAQTAQPWEVEEYARNKAYRLAFRTSTGRETAQRVLTLLLDDGFNLRRFSVRSSVPHLMLVLNVGVLPRTEAAALLRLIRNLSEEVTRPPRPAGPAPAKSQSSPSSTSRSRRSTVPNSVIFPPDGSSPEPGIDSGLTRNGFRSNNGHKKSEE